VVRDVYHVRGLILHLSDEQNISHIHSSRLEVLNAIFLHDMNDGYDRRCGDGYERHECHVSIQTQVLFGRTRMGFDDVCVHQS
jgi:hypothetical protein